MGRKYVSSPATRHYWSSWELLVIKNGMLIRKFIKRDGTSDSLQLIVPRELQREVLWNAHDGLLGGHLGQKKTREKALKKFYWRGIHEDCNNWVNTCDVCARQKRPQRKPHAPLGSMATGAPLDHLPTDILGPFPESTRGNKYVLAVTDYFTKWVEIFPIPDQTAPTCAEIILNEVIAGLGVPTTSILTKAETMRVLYFLNCVTCWKSGRQEQALATPAVMVRLNASIEL